MNTNEIQENINYFLSQVDINLCNSLKNKDNRFPSLDKLLGKFRDQENVWKMKGVDLVNDMVAMTNELCLANLILDKVACKRLDYEPKPDSNNSQKTIDFCISMDTGNIIYCDVKTVQPLVQDDWGKFEKHKKLFPSNVEVILDKDALGGEIWHNKYNSRQAMLNYAREFENKIPTYKDNNNTYFVMIYCSDGFDWRIDHLEDFVDFYFTGKHNPDDPFSEMENKFIADNRVAFLRNINRFAYFERPKNSINETKFICPVRGPWIENRWVSSAQKAC